MIILEQLENSHKPAMACFYPLPAYRTKNGAVVLWKEQPDSLSLRLPCGGCLGCRKAAAKAWALRCSLELSQHARASFITLTYDDAHLPVTLTKHHLQTFLKRARKALAKQHRRIRFFASGEYGETSARPHFHAIVFGLDHRERNLVEDAWCAKGRTQTVGVTPARIAYTAGYTSKKIGWRLDKEERIDYETGEIYTWQPPFIQMSRRPGIGGHARAFASSWRSFAISNGHRMPVPRFLHEAWKATASAEDLEALAFEKSQLPMRDTSPARLAAAEQIAITEQALKGARRPY